MCVLQQAAEKWGGSFCLLPVLHQQHVCEDRLRMCHMGELQRVTALGIYLPSRPSNECCLFGMLTETCSASVVEHHRLPKSFQLMWSL